MSKVVVVGGGVSGLIASIVASQKHEVILLEANDKCGKKILLTGNGKCNYWNQDIHIRNYDTDHYDNLDTILKNQEEVYSFLESIGIYPKIKNGYYYPYSNQASSVRTILIKELERRKVKVIYQFKVEKIQKEENQFILKSSNQELACDQVILATGGKACPKTGSDGSGYFLAESFHHCIDKVTPSLVPLKANDSSLKDWDGVRCDSKVSLYIDNQKIKEEVGEIQLTDYGVSGICIFNLSGCATRSLEQKKAVSLHINFLPSLETDFDNWFQARNKQIPNHTLEELLESILPYKLMLVLFKKSGIRKEDSWDTLSEEKKAQFIKTITDYELEITESLSFDRCQVTAGGVSLSEINPNTMESLIIPHLYLVGELLDVDGKCGGFNMAFAFISGYIAGRSISC